MLAYVVALAVDKGAYSVQHSICSVRSHGLRNSAQRIRTWLASEISVTRRAARRGTDASVFLVPGVLQRAMARSLYRCC